MENHPRLHDKPSSKDATTPKLTVLKRIYVESTGWATHVSRKYGLNNLKSFTFSVIQWSSIDAI